MKTSTSFIAPTEVQLRTKVRRSFLDWAELALEPQNQKPALHHRLIIDELTNIARGRTDRLMLLLPPGSAKSTYASLLFPPWFLAHHPGANVIATSHTSSLARRFGRGVRTLIAEHASRLGYGLEVGNQAAHRFSTTTGATYFATGVRGPITGHRADLVLIDDPVKSQQEADSALARDQLWDWFRSDLSTRLKPGGRMVLIMTRWHPDDLGGRLLEGTDHWRVIRLPALAEAGDLLHRPEGRALWPAWEDEAALVRKREIVGERAFATLFQQQPRRQGGRMFQAARIYVHDDPSLLIGSRAVRAWDLASSTTGNPDWTVGLRLCRTPEQTYVVQDVVRLQGGPLEVEQAILTAAENDGRHVTIGLPQDPGQAGRAQVTYLTRRLAGYVVESSTESGAKHVRAMPVASQANAGNLALLAAPWNRILLEELADFPGGAKDDQVDALSRAFSMLTELPLTGARRVQSALFNR